MLALSSFETSTAPCPTNPQEMDRGPKSHSKCHRSNLTTEILYLPANASCVLANNTSLTTVACDGLRRGPLSPNPPICGKPGIFFLCNQTTLLQCFPPNWTQPCTPIFLTPSLTILTPQAMEDQIQPTCHRRRALAAAPLLLRGGLFMALGLRVGGLGSAMQFYYKLSTDLN